MLLAELEVYHTLPAVPTRRVALGHMVLPVDPSPGFGGILLGAVVAQHIRGVDGELFGDIGRLIDQIDRGERVVQPRLRHRFQVDRHGLAVSRHTMTGAGDDVEFDFGSKGRDLVQVLGAIYALERLDRSHRQTLTSVLHQAVRWRGPIGPALVAHLAGARSAALASLADPRRWALELLGFSVDVERPSRREITRNYRTRLREVHPDHGGDHSGASRAILDLNEARRILNGEMIER